MRIGVDVRGVEIVVDGQLELVGKRLVLKVSGSEEPLELVPLKRKIQWDKKRNQAESATTAEKQAFGLLKEQTRGRPIRVRVTGPLALAKEAMPGKCILEVRKFSIQNDTAQASIGP
jgi:hypothetical protein